MRKDGSPDPSGEGCIGVVAALTASDGGDHGDKPLEAVACGVQARAHLHVCTDVGCGGVWGEEVDGARLPRVSGEDVVYKQVVLFEGEQGVRDLLHHGYTHGLDADI